MILETIRWSISFSLWLPGLQVEPMDIGKLGRKRIGDQLMLFHLGNLAEDGRLNDNLEHFSTYINGHGYMSLPRGLCSSLIGKLG